MNKDNYTVSCIIPAAGQGKRMGLEVNKQYLKLQGKPVLTHTWRVFARFSFIEEIILVVNEKEKELCYKEVVLPYKKDKSENSEDYQIKVVAGGKSRQDSVLNGIMETSEKASYILIHDGARPLITHDLVERVVEKSYEFSAAIAAVPVKDTIKIVNKDKNEGNKEDKFVLETPARDRLWAAQTPQVFEKNLIEKAYRKAQKDSYTGFDDSSLVERTGIYPVIVESSYENIKITTAEDIALADKIMERRGNSCA